ncbi:MAG TPA: ABC transporter permease [Patescibacteria group bacterium]|nr:ABC transporter permease [Patescibacteria group bacterium]
MTAAAGQATDAAPDVTGVVQRTLRRNLWPIGLIVFLVVLFAFTKLIQPSYGVTGIQGLAISIAPLALAAVAQAIVVISGGIDLSIGAMMAFTNVVAATAMRGQSGEAGVAIAIGVLLLGLLIGTINGIVIVVTRIADIVVTLAMSFVWAGCALLVLNVPGGKASAWLTDLAHGYVITEWLPKPALELVLIVALIWIPLRRSRLGLSLFAIGSDRLAAFRSGVSVGRTKIISYALAGFFSALGGLAITANTGIGTPLPGGYTLTSVAAVVLGGVSLAGGRGGVFGPIVAVVILALIRADMTFLNLNSNLATVTQGVILIVVVMFGSLATMRRVRA